MGGGLTPGGFSKMVVVVMEKLLGMCYLPLEGRADDLAWGKWGGTWERVQVEGKAPGDRPSRKSEPHWPPLSKLRKETTEVRSLAWSACTELIWAELWKWGIMKLWEAVDLHLVINTKGSIFWEQRFCQWSIRKYVLCTKKVPPEKNCLHCLHWTCNVAI